MRVYSRLLEIIIEANASEENREYLFPGKLLPFSWRKIQNASVGDAACGAGDGAAPPGPDLLALLSRRGRRRRPLLQPPLLVQEVLGAHLGTESTYSNLRLQWHISDGFKLLQNLN